MAAKKRDTEVEALRAASLYSRNLIETSLDPLVTISAEGKITDVNTATEKVTGLSRERLIGSDFSDYFTDPERARAGYLKVFEQGQVTDYALAIRHTSGTITDVLYNASVYRNERGEVVGVFAAARDITERKRVEEALRGSEHFVSSILESTPDLVYIYDLSEHRNVYTNKEIVDFLGFSPEEIGAFGSSLFENILHPDDVHVVDRHHARMKTARGREVMECEYRMKHANGTWRLLRSRDIAFLRDQTGNVRQILGTAEDITERKWADEALQQANRKLSLLSGITRHDINNRLSVLMGYLEILKDTRLDPQQNEYLQQVSTAATYISAMIQFTKEYEEIGVHAPAWQDCRILIDSATQQATLGPVKMKNDLPVGMEVFSDPLIIKVFYNLMDNAVRYGGKITTIRFSVGERGGDQLIVCEDDGTGIPVKDKEQIFERGFGKNTGLGLALAREILAITGITIRETGEPGKGTRFEMSVPKGAYRFKPS